MARLVVELTNRCNLHCQHCYEERHAATGDLSLEILEQVLQEGKSCGIDHLAFTGGEPTIHRQFAEIIARVGAAGYTFSFVSNGVNFPQIYPLLHRHRQWLKGVTFSLDGAREQTHDWQRGQGSYRRVLRAISICTVKEIPFNLNITLTARNRHEVAGMVRLAERLGSHRLRFGHLMPTPETALRQLDLSPHERREVEEEIWSLRKSVAVRVGMAAGYFSDSPFFSCSPLALQEFNLDYRGNLTLCCNLSGYAEAPSTTDVIGNLREMTLAEGCARFRQRVERYVADKRIQAERGALSALDHFPCWYCVKYLGKVEWLKRFPQHPWAQG
jgi:MoaA/NifB/PqqE/SkfB family radical SAM enzyme